MAEGGRSSELTSTSGMSKESSVPRMDDNESDRLASGEIADGPSIPECAVCLQTCVHPAQLPCGHIFCFLCVKGVAHQSKKCAMCRQDIPPDYIEKPHLIDSSQLGKDSTVFEDGYQWFYEGRNGWWKYDERTSSDLEDIYKLGWWQYDERTSRELENAYQCGERVCELLIAGFLYVADFDAMLQMRRNDPSRRRRIKRDLATIPKKGVAGLRLDGTGTSDDSAEEHQRPKSPLLDGDLSSGNSTPAPPTNTPQTPAGSMVSGGTTPERHESLDEALEQIQSLNLRDYTSASDSEDDRGSGDENQDLPDFSGLVSSPWVLKFSSNEDEL